MKKIFISAAALALITSVTGCATKELNKVKDIAETEIKEEKKEEEEKNKTFDEELSEYNEVYKKALFSTGQEKKDEALKTTQESTNKWKEISSKHAGNQPKEYKKSNWGEFISEINALQNKANELTKEGKNKEAHEELELVRKKIKEVRQENGIKNISDDMLIFHDVMEKLIELKTKEEFMEGIDELKITFTELKGYSLGEEYGSLIFNIEKTISEIENSTPENYIEKRDNLKPAFIKAYLKFG